MKMKIAIIGNSIKFIENNFDLSEYKICRLNFGYKKNRVGRPEKFRTDIVAFSGFQFFSKEMFENEVICIGPKERELIPKEYKDKIKFYPLEWWEELHDIIGNRPSTGCMTIHYFHKLGEDIKIYGFDFWKSATFYTGENRPGPHDPIAEEKFAIDTIGHSNIII